MKSTNWTAAIILLLPLLGCLQTSSAQTVEKLDNYKGAASHTGSVWNFPEYAIACAQVDALAKKSLTQLRIAKDFEKVFNWVGPALGLTEAAMLAMQGKDLDALQKIGAVGGDALICGNAPLICPAWTAGRAMGGMINSAVSMIRSDNKEVSDLLVDYGLSLAYDKPISARELLRLKLAIERGTARRLAEARVIKTCSDPSQTRTGIDAILTKAGMTPAAPPKRTSSALSCAILKDSDAMESLAERDPDAYDAIRLRCLK